MAQSFDIRFARSAGWMALLEAPTNSLRWKGGGLLSIDADGISIAVKRGLLTWFPRTRSRRIAASSLTDVYREGEALRLEFSTPQAARTVLPFWVGDREVAAQIVRLLPTQRTVELEHSTAGSGRHFQFDGRLIAWLLTGVVVLGCGALALRWYLTPSVVPVPAEARAKSSIAPAALPLAQVPLAAPTPPLQDVPEIPIPVRLEAPELLAPSTDTAEVNPDSAPAEPLADGSIADVSPLGWRVAAWISGGEIRVVAGMPARGIARRQVDTFEAECAALRAAYQETRDSPTAKNLQALDARWWDVTLRIYDSQEMQDPALGDLREIELAVARSWHSFLSSYAEGLRTGDATLIAKSFAELKFAESLASRVPQYVP
jgi:hypothetical protein